MIEPVEVQVNTDAGHSITLAEVQNWLKENYGTDATEDALINQLINAGVALAEKYTGISFSVKTLTAYYECTGNEDFELAYGPVDSIDQVRRSVNGTKETLDASQYVVEGGQFKRVAFPYVFSTAGYSTNYIEVDYTTLSGLNDVAKTGVLNYVANMYFHRGEESSGRLDNETKRILFPISRNL